MRENSLFLFDAHCPVRVNDFRKRATVVPTGPFLYRIPFLNGSLKCDGGQADARSEGIIPYARHTLPDGDGCQAAATEEGLTPYARHAARDDD